MKILKYALLALAGIGALLAVAVVIFISTFDHKLKGLLRR
jgi:hypothetical protein